MVGDVITKGSRLTKQGIVKVKKYRSRRLHSQKQVNIDEYCAILSYCHARNGSIVQWSRIFLEVDLKLSVFIVALLTLCTRESRSICVQYCNLALAKIVSYRCSSVLPADSGQNTSGTNVTIWRKVTTTCFLDQAKFTRYMNTPMKSALLRHHWSKKRLKAAIYSLNSGLKYLILFGNKPHNHSDWK